MEVHTHNLQTPSRSQPNHLLALHLHIVDESWAYCSVGVRYSSDGVGCGTDSVGYSSDGVSEGNMNSAHLVVGTCGVSMVGQGVKGKSGEAVNRMNMERTVA